MADYFNEPYNKDLDKITESEVVYDFVERLKLGKDFSIPRVDGDRKLYPANTKLLKLFETLYSVLPSCVLNNLDSLCILSIKIHNGNNYVEKQLPDAGKYTILKVISDKTGMDVTSVVEKGANKIICRFDTAYPYSDEYLIYMTKSK